MKLIKKVQSFRFTFLGQKKILLLERKLELGKRKFYRQDV